MKKYLSPDFWKQGSSEVIGYLTIMPGIIMIVMVVVTIIQLGIINTRLQYVAYVAARAAVTCENYESAVLFAEQAVTRNMATLNVTAIDQDSIQTKLTITNGKVKSDGKPESIAKSKKSRDKLWKKGNYVNCMITADVSSPMFGNAATGMLEKSASITMMIERPAEDDLGLWEDISGGY